MTLDECSKLPYAEVALKLYEESIGAAGAVSRDAVSDNETDAAAIAGLATEAHPSGGARLALPRASEDRVPGTGGFLRRDGEVHGLNAGDGQAHAKFRASLRSTSVGGPKRAVGRVGSSGFPSPIRLAESGHRKPRLWADLGMVPELPPTSPGLHPRWQLVLSCGRDVRDANAPAEERVPGQDVSQRASAPRAGRVAPPDV